MSNFIKSSPFPNRLRSGQPTIGLYTVVKCGASGHNIRSQPSMSASPIGIVNHGDMVNVIAVKGARGAGQSSLSKGEVWVQLDQDAIEKHCFNNDNSVGTEGAIEAWSLALSSNDIQYLKKKQVIYALSWCKKYKNTIHFKNLNKILKI